jgi:photosystem II stability/assembly factor-like uncharacterized protein
MARKPFTKTNSKKQPIETVTIRPGWAVLSILVVLIFGVATSIQTPNPQPGKNSDSESAFEWLKYPVEKYPSLRLPAAPGELKSVSLANDGFRGLAVGTGGIILATTDGGEHWNSQVSGVSSVLFSVHCDKNCEQAWAVGSAATILATDDGGRHWVSERSGVASDIRLRGVHFQKGGQHGWIVGDRGTILVTSDAGKSWQKQITSQTGNLISVYFDADGKRGWVVGFSGVILATADGGQSWHRQRNFGRTLLSVTFGPDGQHGWAVGYDNVQTTDGGLSWKPIPDLKSDPDQTLVSTSVYFDLVGRRGWIVREDGIIFNTEDGGQSWKKQNSGTNVYLDAVRFDAQGQRGVVVGDSGTILSSDDKGRNWITRTSSKASQLNAVEFNNDGKLGWAVGASGTVLATTDGGDHWTAQESGTNQQLNGVKLMSDGRSGWAVGNGGVIIVTGDGGRHWVKQQSGVSVPLNAIDFQDGGQLGWAVGGSGIILSTNNGGQDWHAAKPVSDLPLLHAVYFESEGRRGWAAGTEGVILASADGGQTWDRQNSGTSKNILGLWFAREGMRGWAVGDSGLILTTADGGNTWIAQSSGVTVDLLPVRFTSEVRLGLAAGDAGTILITEDGGVSWSLGDTRVGSGRSMLGFAGSGMAAWAVGYPPALLKSTDGGKTWDPLPWPLSNQRYPAPWFWLTLIPAAIFLRKSVRANFAAPTMDIEAMGTSDVPIVESARDRLQFGAIARGISRFLRNTNTQPPLTMAISGEWGTGKSTLMELVCTDLRQYGTRPVWFNAWHHQTEEHLLAALLIAIRDTGLPPIRSVDGLVFRLRLLLMRSKKDFVLVFASLAAAAVVIGYLLGHDFSEWTTPTHRRSSVRESRLPSAKSSLESIRDSCVNRFVHAT